MPSKEFLAFQSSGGILPPHDFSVPGTMERYREELNMNTLPGGKLPEGAWVEEETVAGVPCSWIRFDNAQEGKLILQIHGGGFSGGVPCTKQGPTIHVAQLCCRDILSVDYRLAPENPYPAALEDCVAVYKEILSRGYSPENIVFMGESAGATLCIVTALYARDHGMPVPGAIAAISPLGDCAKTYEMRKTYREDDPAVAETDDLIAGYVGKGDVLDPYLSPVHADFAGMPPIFFQYGAAEALSEDGAELLRKAVLAGVDVTAHFHKDMSHVFYLMEGVFPEADAAVQELVSYVSSKV